MLIVFNGNKQQETIQGNNRVATSAAYSIHEEEQATRQVLIATSPSLLLRSPGAALLSCAPAPSTDVLNKCTCTYTYINGLASSPGRCACLTVAIVPGSIFSHKRLQYSNIIRTYILLEIKPLHKICKCLKLLLVP